MDILVMILII